MKTSLKYYREDTNNQENVQKVDDLRKTIGKNKKAEESSLKSTLPTASAKSSTPVSKLRVQVNNAKPAVPSVVTARKSPETEVCKLCVTTAITWFHLLCY